MRLCKTLLTAAIVLSILGGFWVTLGRSGTPVHAEEETEAYKRKITLTVNYTAYEWWLVRWKDNAITCRFLIDREGLPIEDEIRTWCGPELANEWKATQPCKLTDPSQSVQSCPGLYVYSFTSYPAQKEVEVELPLPSVYVSITGCSPQPPSNRCTSAPNLLLTGEEPLPNEAVISIHGTVGGEPFSCSGENCTIPLRPTGEQGTTVEFWADSSFGDSSEHYTALVRVLAQGDFMSPDDLSADPTLYYVDVLSSQWRGSEAASCSETWQAFPDVGGSPPWLNTPDQPEQLYTNVSLYYLAGVLISNQQVDASECPNGGLQEPLVANECGKDKAKPAMEDWQNKFDEEILRVARDTGVPAQLLKNIFSRESQFWPGIYQTYKEAGLGQLTEKGADTVLLWNPSFFDQFCPLVLHQERCDRGFGNLSTGEQNMLRGGLVAKVNASCPDCPAGIDLTQAQFSVRVFAEGLLGNCEQVSRVITNLTGQPAGRISSYNDLWRFTLVNYNAGPGCLSTAVKESYMSGEAVNWDNIARRLDPACETAIDYVEDISKTNSGVLPTPTSWVYPGQTLPAATVIVPPTATPGPTLAGTRTPGPSPTPGIFTRTPTPGGYPYPDQPTATTPVGYPPPGDTTTPPSGYP